MDKELTQTTLIRQTIFRWLSGRLNDNAIQWLNATGFELMGKPEDWQLYTSFSKVPRQTGKEMLLPEPDEIMEAEQLRSAWNPSFWTVDQAGRIFLLLCYAEQGEEEFLEKIEKIFITSDLGEAVALYQALPLYPFPKKFTERAAEGIRSNITTVFEAVALHNPYPMEYFEEGAWNQVVLKALFVGSPLYKIIGLDQRANPTLAKVLVEYAHERWSAGRSVSPELWRPVAPFLDDTFVEDLKHVLGNRDMLQKMAAILTLSSSSYSGKKEILAPYREIQDEMEKKKITWELIGKMYEDGTY